MSAGLDWVESGSLGASRIALRALELLLCDHRENESRRANQRAALDAAAAAYDYARSRQLSICAVDRAECMRRAIKVALDIAGAAGAQD